MLLWRCWRSHLVRMQYNAVSAWLSGTGALNVPDDVKDQLRLHVEASQLLAAHRRGTP